MIETILTAEGITLDSTLGKLRLNGIDFSIDSGQCVCFYNSMGEAEAGLLEVFACLQKPTAGRLVVIGEQVNFNDYDLLCRQRMKIGYVSPDCALLSNMTVYDNLALVWRYHGGFSEKEIKEMIHGWAGFFQLTDSLMSRPAQLDREFRKRAIYVKEFIKKPRLMLLDRPSTDLSQEGETLVKESLYSYLENNSGAVVLNSDEAEFYRSLAEKVIYLKDGKVHREEVFARSGNGKIEGADGV